MPYVIFPIVQHKALNTYNLYINIEGFVFTEPSFYYYKPLAAGIINSFPFLRILKALMKSSYFDRYARSHRSIRTLTSVDTHAYFGRSKTTFIKEFQNLHIICSIISLHRNVTRMHY